jgi:uncharacterized protein
MKHYTKFLQLSIMLLLLISIANGQQKDIYGYWVGKVDLPTAKFTTIFDIRKSTGKIDSVFLSIPEQGAEDLPGALLGMNEDSLIIFHGQLNRTFYGEFVNDSTIKGDWQKNRIGIPITLKKSDKKPGLNRPQTPFPPFPYPVEEVEYTNPKSGLKLAGTLTIPDNVKNCPAVVLISGSGAQDRDETIFEHKPFAVIADYLARNGIATLRVDDRGVGGSEGNITEATSKDFAGDVLAGVEFLRNRKEIDPEEIGLMGHSEGGLIAPIAAIESDDVAFIVLMAGPGMTGEQILYEQNDLVLKAAGMPDYSIQQNRLVQQSIFEVLKNEPDSAKAVEQLRMKLSQGMYAGMNEQMQKAVDEKIAGVNSPWFRYFLTYDPQPTLAKVKCPVLAVNGSKDVQVPVSNLKAIYDAVQSGGNQHVDTARFENHNHLFQHSETGAVGEYSQIEETIDPAVLKILKDWIIKVTSE